MRYFLSIDLGTMGVKTTLLNENAHILSKKNREYCLISSAKDQAEQDPQDWWVSLVKNLNEIKDEEEKAFANIEAVSICGQMHTHVHLDQHNRPLGKAITWLDQRSAYVIDRWQQTGEYTELFNSTANFPTTSYTAPNLVRTREKKPEIFNKTARILLAKDYIKYKMTGRMATDPSDASGTLLYDVERLKWSDEAFRITGLSRTLFPDVLDSTAIMGRISGKAALETGIKEGTPVINGGSDHSVAEIGSGLFESGSASIIVGTAGVVATCSDEPKKDEKQRIICWAYPLKGRWDLLGLTQTAASCLTWFRDTFDGGSDDEIFNHYSTIASRIPPGSDGLLFLPYLLGERTPYWDSKARGIFFGISMNHRKAQFVRAIMEGVIFSLKNCLDVFQELGIQTGRIKTLGGGSKSGVWKQIMASAIKREIYTLESEEPSAVGNLVLAGLGTGRFESIDEAKKIIKLKDKTVPDDNETGIYNEQYRKYLTLYERLSDLY